MNTDPDPSFQDDPGPCSQNDPGPCSQNDPDHLDISDPDQVDPDRHPWVQTCNCLKYTLYVVNRRKWALIRMFAMKIF